MGGRGCLRTVGICPGPYRSPRGGGQFLMSEVPLHNAAEGIVFLRKSICSDQFGAPVLAFLSISCTLGDVCLWVGVPCASSALVVPLPESSINDF